MTKRISSSLLAVLALAGLGLVGCATASAAPKPPVAQPAAEAGAPKGGPGAMFKNADKNHDGKVTLEEARALSGEKFAAADTNKDGQIEPEEMRALGARMGKGDRAGRGHGRGHARGQGQGQGLKRLDKDGNGMISKEEAPPRLKDRFDEVDANKDGQIDKEEMKAARAKRGEGPKGDRGREARGEGRGQGRGPMAKLDTNGDGKLSSDEFGQRVNKWFEKLDANKDGAVTEAEVQAARPGRRPAR